jgi:hypothetical protein
MANAPMAIHPHITITPPIVAATNNPRFDERGSAAGGGDTDWTVDATGLPHDRQNCAVREIAAPHCEQKRDWDICLFLQLFTAVNPANRFLHDADEQNPLR